MITYLTVQFSSEGVKPSKVLSTLQNLGFKPATGFYDFQYDWKDDASIDDVIGLADRVAASLKGMRVIFKLETTGQLKSD